MGEAKSLKEVAERKGIENSYASRMVNLTTPAPDIVVAILGNALPSHFTLFDLAVDPPALREEQRSSIGVPIPVAQEIKALRHPYGPGGHDKLKFISGSKANN